MSVEDLKSFHEETATDEEYKTYVAWLSDVTAEEMRAAKGDAERQERALARYWKHGFRAGLGNGALIDFLAVDTPSILEVAGYDDAESDAALRLSDSLDETTILAADV